MMNNDVIVAGYICLDLLPELYPADNGMPFEYVPGKLLEVGGTRAACGGAVPNTGLALHKLGHRPRLLGKVGADAFGSIVKELVESAGQGLSRSLINDEQLHTANTFIISPPGQDRMFLAHAGANRNFSSDDVLNAGFDGVRLLHFGYPPLLDHSFRDNGNDTKKMFQVAKSRNVTTSLDMCLPDPEAKSAKIDWNAWLDNVLPQVDVFLPSIDELVFMLGEDELDLMADKLLQRGVAVVVIKLGSRGVYVKTTDNLERLAQMGACTPVHLEQWQGMEFLVPCFEAKVKGTTGAGDCTIAGFLSGLLRGMSAADAGRFACAVGSCNVEAPDAYSGLMDFDATLKRLNSGWNMEDDCVDKKIWRKTNAGVYARSG